MPMNAAMPKRKSKMAEIALVIEAEGWPEEADLEVLCASAIDAAEAEVGHADGGVCIMFGDDQALQVLNASFRNKDKPTNVLSFPAARSMKGQLGDIALGRETVFREAKEKSISLDHHVSHLVMHGFLHLLGYDHQTEVEAVKMEALERAALMRLGIADPYQEVGNE